MSITNHFCVLPGLLSFPGGRGWAEVDSYFSAFERVAAALKWPTEAWPLLLQCRLSGKAQEVVASLSLQDSLSYEVVKQTVLRAYELVPEAYRQRFRGHKKTPTRTFVEFARDKESLFDRWCLASKAKTLADVRELILLEDFKNHLPENIVVYLNEQKVASIAQAAVLADEYALTHKTVFSGFRSEGKLAASPHSDRPLPNETSRKTGNRECYYCHRVGHVIATLRNKPKSPPRRPRDLGLVEAVGRLTEPALVPDPGYKPFMSVGWVSLTADHTRRKPVGILRDTGCAVTDSRQRAASV